jgi:hypothetical protein
MKQVIVEDVELVLHGCSCDPEVLLKVLAESIEVE